MKKSIEIIRPALEADHEAIAGEEKEHGGKQYPCIAEDRDKAFVKAAVISHLLRKVMQNDTDAGSRLNRACLSDAQKVLFPCGFRADPGIKKNNKKEHYRI